MGKLLRKLYIPAFLLGIVIFIGIAGYMIIEDFDFIEAFYMTVIAISTVGFGTIHPFSHAGMIFTSFLIIFSFGIFAYAVSTFTHLAVEGVLKNYFLNRQVKKRIKKLNNHVIICGYGRNGKQASIELAEHNENFIIIEKSIEVSEDLRENTDILFVNGDASNEDILEQAQIKKAKAIITTLPNDADNLYIVLSARELNPKIKIISRASEDHADKKLKRAGADNVIMPDKIGGQRMAKLVAQPDIVEFLENILLQSHNDVSLEEIDLENLKHEFDNISIRELGARNSIGANIIGLKAENGQYLFNPGASQKITKDYKLFVLGNPAQIARFKELLLDSE
jgi:voltage-gated potassium channel